jgi:hypothetical protein
MSPIQVLRPARKPKGMRRKAFRLAKIPNAFACPNDGTLARGRRKTRFLKP